MIKCHDQDNLQKEEFIWGLELQRDKSPSLPPQASIATGRYDNWRNWGSHFTHKLETERADF